MGFDWTRYGNRRYDAKTWNCWTLVAAFYRDNFAIELPRYIDDREIVPDLFVDEASRWNRVDEPQAGDVITFRINGLPRHCGIVINRREMLHLLKGCEVVVESYDIPMWRKRIDGIYRHTDRL